MTRSAPVTVRRPGARTTPATRTRTWRQTAGVKEAAKGCSHAASTAGTLVGMAQAFLWRVLGQHRYEVGDPVVSGEASEQGDADVHHALGLRDDDRAPSEPGQPMALAGVVPLDAMRLLLARVELSDRQEHVIDHVIVGAVQARAPALQPRDQALAGDFVTTAAFPVHQLA